jgi:hypothetical protein
MTTGRINQVASFLSQPESYEGSAQRDLSFSRVPFFKGSLSLIRYCLHD